MFEEALSDDPEESSKGGPTDGPEVGLLEGILNGLEDGIIE